MSGTVVTFEVEDGIGVITVDNPPVNALSPDLRDGISAAIERGNADPAVRAMVLIGAGRSFIAGADIRAFGKPACVLFDVKYVLPRDAVDGRL